MGVVSSWADGWSLWLPSGTVASLSSAQSAVFCCFLFEESLSFFFGLANLGDIFGTLGVRGDSNGGLLALSVRAGTLGDSEASILTLLSPAAE